MRDKLTLFNEAQILNKSELLYSLHKFKEHLEKTEIEGSCSKKKKSILINLVEKFILKINESNLPDLNKWWFYDYDINSFDIKLSLCHCSEVEYDDIGNISAMTLSEIYDIISLQCKMLTVNEFADLYKVKPLTVRQWIRRGKLREIKKLGKEWFISELANTPSRKYEPVSYYWSKELLWENDFSYLNNYKHVFISQSKNDKSMYDITLGWSGDTNRKNVQITKKEREKLELMLLSNEFVIAEPLFSGIKYCPAKEQDETFNFSNLKYKHNDEEIITNYGCVLVTKGAHKGQIGIYDNDNDAFNKAIVYFGDMYVTEEYYEIPYSFLSRTIPTISLTERMQKIYPEVNRFRHDYKKQKDLLSEYILCYNILNERYLNSMNTINQTKEIQIFISHATKDMYFARSIATDLMEAGYSVFLDDWSIDMGERIYDKINDSLECSSALVMIISKNYLKSTCCGDEWGAFYKKASSNKNCMIYPIIIDDSEPPALISTIKYARIESEDGYEINLNKLLKALKKHYN